MITEKNYSRFEDYVVPFIEQANKLWWFICLNRYFEKGCKVFFCHQLSFAKIFVCTARHYIAQRDHVPLVDLNPDRKYM